MTELQIISNSASGSDKKSKRRWPIGLQVQFQIALGTIFLLFCGVTAWLIYSYEKNLIEENALAKSRIVLAAVESTRAYVRNTLRPRMYELAGQEAFIIEAMSTSYISRAVMDKFHESMPAYRYRRVAERTRDLEDSRSRLRDKIQARNRELQTLNRIAELTTGSFRLENILPGALEQTLELIPARGRASFQKIMRRLSIDAAQYR